MGKAYVPNQQEDLMNLHLSVTPGETVENLWGENEMEQVGS